MQKTLTLYPRYITDGSNFSGILSANGTGEDYRTLRLKDGHHTDDDKLHVGTIAFETSALWNKSKACLINGYSINYDQKASPDWGSGAGAVYACVGKLIEDFSINGTTLVVNSMNDFGESAWQWSTETDDSWHGKSCTFLNSSVSDVIGYEKLLGFDLTMALRSPVIQEEKAYMRNLQANVTYTARYYARFFDDNNLGLDKQTVEGGNAPTVTPEILTACAKEGYNLVGWEDRNNNPGVIYPTPPVSEDTDIYLYPVYEKIKFRITAPNTADTSEFMTLVYDESAQQWTTQNSYSAADTVCCDVEYGKKVRIYACNMADESEDIKVVINGTEKSYTGNAYVLVFETDKLTESVTISSVEVSAVYFDISTAANIGGTVTPSFRVQRTYEYCIEILPDTGYEISKITKNGTEITVTDNSGMVINDVASGDVSYVVTFSRIKIPITLNYGEKISVTGKTVVDYGSEEKWVVTAADGYSINTITVNGETVESFFKKQDSYTLNHVFFEPATIDITASNSLVTVTALDCENGEITGDTGTYIKGKGTLNLEAKPDPGYRFSAWTGIEKDTQSFTIDTADAEDSYTLGATFEAYDYQISVNIIGNGQVLQSENYVNYDDSVTLKALPNEGWHFVSWAVEREGANGLSALTDEEFTIENIRSNVNVTATFAISQFLLETKVSSPDGAVGGTISGNTAEEYDYGIKLTLEAVPADGYYFIKWSDGVYMPKREFVIPAGDTSLTAFFIRYEYKITAESESGRVELTTESKTTENKATVRHGENLTLLITPDFGYRVSDVLLDGISIKNDLTTTRRNTRYLLQNVTGNHEIAVDFEAKMYTNSRKLIDYYPPVIAAIKDMQEIVKGQQPLIDELWDAVSFVTENQFIDTATEEGVEQWEKELGIVPSGFDTLAQRKKRLKNKWVPDNRFTMIWLYDWLRQVSERNGIKKPTVKDYVLTVTLPAIVDYLSIFADLENYKPANIKLNSVISLSDDIHDLTAGIGMRVAIKITLESEVETSEN